MKFSGQLDTRNVWVGSIRNDIHLKEVPFRSLIKYRTSLII